MTEPVRDIPIQEPPPHKPAEREPRSNVPPVKEPPSREPPIKEPSLQGSAVAAPLSDREPQRSSTAAEKTRFLATPATAVLEIKRRPHSRSLILRGRHQHAH
jgi:hypothetical protein